MDTLYKEQEEFFSYVEKSIVEKKKLSHAYLIETNSFPEYWLITKEMIKKILTIDVDERQSQKIIYQIDHDSYSDLEIVNPDGAYIKKEQLINIEMKFSKKSMLDNKMIYVINGADKLNQSSANTILKFLEEPPENIVAILITDNKYNVIDTIVSRCQCLTLKNKDVLNQNEDIEEFVKNIGQPKKILIDYDYYLEKLFSTNSIAQESLKSIEEQLSAKLKENIEAGSEDYIIGLINEVDKSLEKLQYNVNLKLFFTNFIFSLMEVNPNV